MGKRYVSFTLGDGRYCILVDHVQQIMRLENLIEVPKAPPSVEGAINLRGDIIPVVDLRSRLTAPPDAGPRREIERRKRRVVISRLDNRTFGLDVDEVREIVDIDDAGISPEPFADSGPAAALCAGIARGEGGTFMILDLPRVLAALGASANGRAEEP